MSAGFLQGFLGIMAPQQPKLSCLVDPEVPNSHMSLFSLALTLQLSGPSQRLTARCQYHPQAHGQIIMLVAPGEILISESQNSVLKGNGFALRENKPISS